VNSVVVFEKAKKEDVFFEDKTVFIDDKTMADLVPFLENRKMQEVFHQLGTFLSKEFRNKYRNLYKLLGGTLIPAAGNRNRLISIDMLVAN
jgi:hypothetical protein